MKRSFLLVVTAAALAAAPGATAAPDLTGTVEAGQVLGAVPAAWAPAAPAGLSSPPGAHVALMPHVVVDALSADENWMPGDVVATGVREDDNPVSPGCTLPDDNMCESWTTLVGQGELGSSDISADTASKAAMHPDGSRYYIVGSASVGDSFGDASIVAIDPVTGQELWSDQYDVDKDGSDRYEKFADVVVSPDGSRVFAVGVAATPSGYFDVLAVAYDARTGERLWAVTSDGPAGRTDEPYGIDVSPDGTALFIVGRTVLSQGLALALSAVDGALLWQHVVAGPSAVDMATDVVATSGMLYVAAFADNPDAVDASDPSFRDAVVIARSASDGRELWRAQFDDGGDKPWRLAVDEADQRVFLLSMSQSSTSEGEAFATVAFDATSGDELWRDRYEGDLPDGYNLPTALALDREGDRVFVSGLATNTRFADYDFATVAYDAATGDRLWTAETVSPRDERVWATSLSDDGSRLYLTGRSGQPYVVGGSGGGVTMTIAYDAATGSQIWAAAYAGDSLTQFGSDPVSVDSTPDGERVVTAGNMNYLMGDPMDPRDIVALGYDDR